VNSEEMKLVALCTFGRGLEFYWIACISAVVVLVLNIVVIFRKTGHLEETITTILVLKRRNMMTLCLQVSLLSRQSNMRGN